MEGLPRDPKAQKWFRGLGLGFGTKAQAIFRYILTILLGFVIRGGVFSLLMCFVRSFSCLGHQSERALGLDFPVSAGV